MSVAGQLERALRPVMDRIRGLMVRGSVRRVIAGTTGDLASLQVRLGEHETLDGIRYVQPVGFASQPRAGAEAWVFFPHGGRGLGFAMAVDDRRGRPNLEEGESVLYNPITGAEIRCAADGSMRVKGDLVVEGSITSSGEVGDLAGTMEQMRQIYNGHTHSGHGAPPVPPMPPGGGA